MAYPVRISANLPSLLVALGWFPKGNPRILIGQTISRSMQKSMRSSRTFARCSVKPRQNDRTSWWKNMLHLNGFPCLIKLKHFHPTFCIINKLFHRLATISQKTCESGILKATNHKRYFLRRIAWTWRVTS